MKTLKYNKQFVSFGRNFKFSFYGSKNCWIDLFAYS